MGMKLPGYSVPLVLISPSRVDLDIESGGSSSYVAFVNQIRANAAGASKTYVAFVSLCFMLVLIPSR